MKAAQEQAARDAKAAEERAARDAKAAQETETTRVYIPLVSMLLISLVLSLLVVTALIAEERANIVQIEHDRAFSGAPIGDTDVELTLETSGRAQIERVLARLDAAGYRAEERRG